MNAKRADLFAVLILLLAPLLLLGPCIFGSAKHVPFDLAQFPPVQTKLSSAQLQEVRYQQNADVTEIPVMFMPEWEFASQDSLQAGLPTGTLLRAAAPPCWPAESMGSSTR